MLFAISHTTIVYFFCWSLKNKINILKQNYLWKNNNNAVLFIYLQYFLKWQSSKVG